MSIQPICMRRSIVYIESRKREYFVADDDDSYSLHENVLHTQHHRKAKEKQRIFSLSLLIPQQLLCMLCVPIQLFFTKNMMPWANYTSIIAKYGSLSVEENIA